MVQTPVLFITFVRPDYARQTWDGIKAAQPKKLYFYSNKGRADKEGEVNCNNEIRAYINEIDWECDLHTFFRDECVNIYDSLRGAIDWLFDNEERGIILEEDCVPTKAFFSFVDQMLDKFEYEDRVWCISGDNYVDEALIEDDYYFSHYHYMYGWATWASRWARMDWQAPWVKKEITKTQFKNLYKTRDQVSFRVKELRGMVDFINRTKCWDYLFGYTMDCNNALTVHPKYHLVTNVGLSGTHHESGKNSKINKLANPVFDEYTIEQSPADIVPNYDVDYLIYKMFQYASFPQKVKSSLQYRVPLYFGKIMRVFKKIYRSRLHR